MERARDDFLPRACFAENEHRSVSVGREPDHLVHIAHRCAGADQACGVHLAHRPRRDRALSRQHPRQQCREFLATDRLRQMVEGAEPHRFDRVLGAGERREHDDGRRVHALPHAAQDFDAIHIARHAEIE
jgi:hypothetical protein